MTANLRNTFKWHLSSAREEGESCQPRILNLMKIPLKDESYLKLKAFRRMKAKKIQSVLESIVEGSFSD